MKVFCIQLKKENKLALKNRNEEILIEQMEARKRRNRNSIRKIIITDVIFKFEILCFICY